MSTSRVVIYIKRLEILRFLVLQMADRVVVAIAVLFVAFLLPYLFQWYRAHYSYDDVLHDVDVPEDLALHSEEFEQPHVIMVSAGGSLWVWGGGGCVCLCLCVCV